MPKHYYVERKSTDKLRFVRVKPSCSHNHKPHRHHDGEHKEHCETTTEYCKVPLDAWNRVKDREHTLQETNSRLLAEVDTLKASLAAARAESRNAGSKERERTLQETNSRLVAEAATLKTGLASAQAEAEHLRSAVMRPLESKISVLTADNESLRKSLDKASENECKHCRQEGKLRQSIEKLEKEKKELKDENGALRDEVRHLRRQGLEQACRCRRSSSSSGPELLRDIESWRGQCQCRYWRERHDDAKRRYDDLCGTLEDKKRMIAAYKEILRRRGIIR